MTGQLIRFGPFEVEVEPAALGVRWWAWTEYEWVRVAVGDYVDSYQRPIATHRVITLGYHELRGDGGEQLLIATEDHRLFAVSPHAVFPVTDDAAALDGAEACRDRVIARLAVAPRLL